ncbi:hypothetical protein D3C85_293210 [compost metagenome]
MTVSNVLPFKRSYTTAIGEFKIEFQHKHLEDGSWWIRFKFVGNKEYSKWERVNDH